MPLWLIGCIRRYCYSHQYRYWNFGTSLKNLIFLLFYKALTLWEKIVALNNNIPFFEMAFCVCRPNPPCRNVPEWAASCILSSRPLDWFRMLFFYGRVDTHRHTAEVACIQRLADVKNKAKTHFWRFQLYIRYCYFLFEHFSIKCIYGSCVYLYSIQIYCKIKRANRTRAILFFLAHAALVSVTLVHTNHTCL